jgi:hypothetical protein
MLSYGSTTWKRHWRGTIRGPERGGRNPNESDGFAFIFLSRALLSESIRLTVSGVRPPLVWCLFLRVRNCHGYAPMRESCRAMGSVKLKLPECAPRTIARYPASMRKPSASRMAGCNLRGRQLGTTGWRALRRPISATDAARQIISACAFSHIARSLPALFT